MKRFSTLDWVLDRVSQALNLRKVPRQQIMGACRTVPKMPASGPQVVSIDSGNFSYIVSQRSRQLALTILQDGPRGTPLARLDLYVNHGEVLVENTSTTLEVYAKLEPLMHDRVGTLTPYDDSLCNPLVASTRTPASAGGDDDS